MNIQNYSNHINYTKWGSACENRFCLRLQVSETQTETSPISKCLTVLLSPLHSLFHNESTMIASMHAFRLVQLVSKSHSTQYYILNISRRHRRIRRQRSCRKFKLTTQYLKLNCINQYNMYVHNLAIISITQSGDQPVRIVSAFSYISQLSETKTKTVLLQLPHTVLLSPLHFLFNNESTMIASMHAFRLVQLVSKSHSTQYQILNNTSLADTAELQIRRQRSCRKFKLTTNYLKFYCINQYNIYVHNYGNYINYTKQGTACEDRFCLYISQLRVRPRPRLSVLIQLPHGVLLQAYTLSFTTSQP